MLYWGELIVRGADPQRLVLLWRDVGKPAGLLVGVSD